MQFSTVLEDSKPMKLVWSLIFFHEFRSVESRRLKIPDFVFNSSFYVTSNQFPNHFQLQANI
jgi:hypothetical protein